MQPFLHKASKVLLIFLFAAILDSAPAVAQVLTSSMQGRITNTEAEPVYSAVVIAIHTESNTKYYAVANQLGRYQIDGMRPGGPYTVEIISMGYTTATHSGLYFDLAENYTLNAVLEFSTELLSGAIVVAERPRDKLVYEKMGVSNTISLEENTYISTKNNTITDLLSYSPYSGKGLSIAGADGLTTRFSVDGAQFNNNFGLGGSLPGGGNPISIEALSQIQVDITPYDVRQTDFYGGNINAITKSGTNTFAGTTYIYHRNEYMRGNRVTGTDLSNTRGKEPTTTYGFTLGGPIVKDKVFFFTNVELSAMPRITNKWKASTDGVAVPDQYISRTLESDMVKVHNHVLEKYGYDTGLWNEISHLNNNIKALARLDWNISDRTKLSLRYNYTIDKAWRITNGTSMDGGMKISNNRSSAKSMVFANSLYFIENYANGASLTLNSRLSNKFYNEFLATFSHLGKERNSPSEPFPFIDILKEGTESAPENYISLGYEPFTWNNSLINNTVTIKNDLIYYGPKHRIMIGANYEYHLAKNSYMRNGTGYYRYSSLSDFLDGNEPEIVALTYGYNNESQPCSRIEFNKIGVYLQDEHSISDNFRVSLGARLDFVYYDDSHLIHNDAIYNIDYSGHGYHLGQGRTITVEQDNEALRLDTGHWPENDILISPRFGFNWDLLPDKSLTISGGTGIFSGRIPLVFFVNMPMTNGTTQYQAVFNESGWYGAYAADMSLFRGGLVTNHSGKPTITALRNFLIYNNLSPRRLTEESTIPPLVAAIDPELKLPQAWKSSIELEYKIPVSFPLSVKTEFVYTKTITDLLVTDYSIQPIETFEIFEGTDCRPLFPDQDKLPLYTTESGKVVEVPSTYVFTNTDEGYGYMFSASIETSPVKNLSLTASYTHTASYLLTGMPDDHASTVISYVPNVYGLNYILPHPHAELIPDKFLATATYNDNWNNHYSFTLMGHRGEFNYSYMFINDMNNDGYIYDLIYIPMEGDDISFVSEDDRNRFMSFVARDKYLSAHRGEYAKAYAVYSPWIFRLDFNYAHNFIIKSKNNSHKLQINLDFKNILNLFNSSWGVSKILNPALNEGRILRTTTITPDNRPIIETISSLTPTIDIWVPHHSVSECWYAKIGIKYFFN